MQGRSILQCQMGGTKKPQKVRKLPPHESERATIAGYKGGRIKRIRRKTNVENE